MQRELNCQCGQRIYQENILHREYYLRPFGTHLVYLKYQCPQCHKLSEQFIRQSEWSESMLLPDFIREASEQQQETFEELGPITAKEAMSARDALENSNPLTSLKTYLKKR